MPSEASVQMVGADVILNRLRAMARDFPLTVARAMREEAEIEMTEAKKRTPVKTGALRASGTVVGPEHEGSDVVVRMHFGNASVDYAFKVHEDLESFHRNGQAKFLESVLLESRRFLADRIAARASQYVQNGIR